MSEDWKVRLRREMDLRGLNMKELSLRAGLGETGVRDALEKVKSPRQKTVKAIADALGMSLAQLMEGAQATAQQIKVIGSTTTAEEWAPSSHRKPKLETVSLSVNGEPISIIVADDTMRSAGYRRGDLLVGVRQNPATADNLIGVDCIVMTEDGRGLVKFLSRGEGRGRFTLRSYSPTTDDIPNVRLSWVAPIIWIKRRQ